MKSNNRSDYFIAFIVVACSIVLLSALTVALTGFTFKKSDREITIDFPSVAGVRVNSQLRYAGMAVGKVNSMKWLTAEERIQSPLGAQNVIRITASLENDAPPLYEGTTASIISDTILAEKFVDLDPVEIDPSKPAKYAPLPAGEAIQGKQVVGFDDLTRSGYNIISEVNNIISQIKQDCPDFPQRVSSLLTHAESAIRNADALASRLEKIIDKNDPRLNEIIANLQVTTQNLKVTTTYTKALSYTIGEKPWRLIWGGTPNELPTEKQILKSPAAIPFPPDSEQQKDTSPDKSKKPR